MARGRMISKSWSTSKKRAAIYREAGVLAEFCLQLFPLIVSHSDDYGRFDGDPETIKLKCDPGSPRPVDEFEVALRHFEAVGLVQRYMVNGDPWLQIIKFDNHQPGLLSKRTKPISPAPPTHPEVLEDSVLTKPNLTELNRTQEEKSAETSSAPFLVFPVVGLGGTAWQLSEDQVSEWATLFPGLDVRGECRKALAWLKANNGRRKTAVGMPRFLAGWLTRSVDRGGPRHAPVSTINWHCPTHGLDCRTPQQCDLNDRLRRGKAIAS